MSKARPVKWQHVFWVNPCPTCGANVGHPCITKTGKESTNVHQARTLNGRCVNCGSPLAEGQMDGDLCGRCQLVRALETERATTYRRHDP